MKNVLFALAVSLGSLVAMAQQHLPSIDLKNLDGEIINTEALASNEGPTVISFWATWCKPCQRELDMVNELYDEWKEETNVTVYAISIDDARNVSRVGPLVNGKGWELEVLLDVNSDLKRALNVGTIPHTFLLDKTGAIVYQHNGYTDGDEEELFEEIEKVAAK